jgi:hypothetical protein
VPDRTPAAVVLIPPSTERFGLCAPARRPDFITISYQLHDERSFPFPERRLHTHASSLLPVHGTLSRRRQAAAAVDEIETPKHHRELVAVVPEACSSLYGRKSLENGTAIPERSIYSRVWRRSHRRDGLDRPEKADGNVMSRPLQVAPQSGDPARRPARTMIMGPNVRRDASTQPGEKQPMALEYSCLSCNQDVPRDDRRGGHQARRGSSPRVTTAGRSRSSPRSRRPFDAGWSRRPGLCGDPGAWPSGGLRHHRGHGQRCRLARPWGKRDGGNPRSGGYKCQSRSRFSRRPMAARQ